LSLVKNYIFVSIVVVVLGEGMEKLHGDPTDESHSKAWTEVKNGSSAKDGTPERLRCGTIQRELLESRPFGMVLNSYK